MANEMLATIEISNRLKWALESTGLRAHQWKCDTQLWSIESTQTASRRPKDYS